MIQQSANPNATNSELDAKQIITNEDKMARMLRLTNDQFDALYELLDETITDISSDLDPELVDLNDIEIYQVYKQLNTIRGKS